MTDSRKRTPQHPLAHGLIILVAAVIGVGVGWMLLHAGG
jgi:hypothetical protein